MSNNSSIEWTGATWNPVTGCVKVSPGCKHCYAETLAGRLKKMGQRRYANGFAVTLHQDILELPLVWKKPRLVFVNSMSDLFHEKVPVSFIRDAFDVMRKASWHEFQVLTKRSERMLELLGSIDLPANVWMGVSVENQDYSFRVSHLLETNAEVRFLSLEPLLGPLPDLNLHGIDWVIVGGESGTGARKMNEDWVLQIKRQCHEFDVPFFFKQWGGVNKKKTGRLLQGRTWDMYPRKSRFG